MESTLVPLRNVLTLPKVVIIQLIDDVGNLRDIVQLDEALQSNNTLRELWKEAVKDTRPLTFNSRVYTNIESLRWVLKREPDLKNFAVQVPGIEKGLTSLGWAVMKGAVDITEAIVSRNLPPDIRPGEQRGTTGMHKTFSSRLNTMMSLKRKEGWIKKAPIHLAVENNQHEAAKILIKYGADPTIRDGRDWTPLLLALSNGAYESAQVLVEAAPHNCPSLSTADLTSDELFPLHWAAKADRLSLVRMMLNKGADPNAVGACGETPLMSAFYGGNHEVAQLLVEHGSSPHLVGSHGMTMLHWAAVHDKPEAARVLLKAGAKPGVLCHHNETALNKAVTRGNFAVATMLLEGSD